MTSISRAQFLRGDWRGKKPDVRPPWALSEPAFSDACDGCGNCVVVCKEKIIKMSARKLPLLDFSQGGCTFCGDCVDVCEPGALAHNAQTDDTPWQFKAVVGANCLAKKGTSCIRCIEECEIDAIVARPALGGRMEIQVDPTSCTGCGMCITTCPVNEISLEHPA